MAALEVMSRFAVDPRWLVYLPPMMSPTATLDREGLLEQPHEAFAVKDRWSGAGGMRGSSGESYFVRPLSVRGDDHGGPALQHASRCAQGRI